MTTFARYAKRLMVAKLAAYSEQMAAARLKRCSLCRWVELGLERGWIEEPIAHRCGEWMEAA